jgi:altronate dehydratase small subunit
MSRVLVVNEKDNVAVALEALEKGAEVLVALPGGSAQERIVVKGEVPFGHKLALTDIAAGENVIKYGHVIGNATSGIRRGEHVHVHNVASGKGRGDLNSPRG